MKLRHITKLIVGATVAANGVISVPGHAFETSDPFKLYGPSIEFAVFRKGAEVGTHRVTFKHGREALHVEAELQIDIKLLFVTVYSYRYRSIATWRNGNLIRLTADVDDDGEKSRVVVSSDADGVTVDGPGGNLRGPSDVLPTNHWNAAVLAKSVVLNTLTGHLNTVTILDRGVDEVQANGTTVRARHYVYTGDLTDTEVWYDEAGRWVGMKFKGKDDSTIEYRCIRCARERVERSAS